MIPDGTSGHAPGEFKLTVVDVGHGSATVLCSDLETVLIDAGGGVAIVEYLKSAGRSEIDCVVISHADRDHVGGLIALLSTREIRVRKVILNSDGGKTSASWLNLAYELDKMLQLGQVEVVAVLRAGDLIPTHTPGLSLKVLAPRHRLVQLGVGNRDRERRRITSNSMSGVISVSFGTDQIALVTGDLDAVGWSHLLDAGHDLRAEILVVPHHGGKAGSEAETAEMLKEMVSQAAPVHAYISNGRGLHGTPRPEVIRAIRNAAPAARIACTQLSTRCLADGGSRPEMLAREQFSAGARSNACCAGTEDVIVRTGERVSVNVKSHQEFVDSISGTAMCRVALEN